MIRRIGTLFIALALALPLSANEGMWLPMLLNRSMEDMKEHGLKLSAEDIYSINNGSLKDAVVSLGGFCTAEVISDKGLLLTNHHCGYSSIQEHSSTENDYLTDGFWAKSLKDEKPNEGLYVRFLVRMEDVTNKVLDSLSDSLAEGERQQMIQKIGSQIAEEAKEEGRYEANVKSFFHGNEFYLFVYERYDDVRLVGAPPESIGKFGGDTDNWMWPRHTGDFSLFRVYAGPDGEPASYDEENIPLKPKHSLPISLDGVKEGDFTMVMGFPGSTDRFRSSHGVQQAIDTYNPTIVHIRDHKLDIMDKYMEADKATRIKYATKYAQTANYWKYFQGQTEQLQNNKVKASKKKIEDDFSAWVAENSERKEKYGEALDLLKKGYQEKEDYVKGSVYISEAGLRGAELPLFAYRINSLLERYAQTMESYEEALDTAETDSATEAITENYESKLSDLREGTMEFYADFIKDYERALDKELMEVLFELYYEEVEKDQLPEFLREAGEKKDGELSKYVKKVFEKTFVLDSAEIAEFLEKPKMKKLEKDRAIEIGTKLVEHYRSQGQSHSETENKLDRGYRLFTAGLREMNPDVNYYPDANSTMRLTYGTVGSYKARDAVHYDYYTTAQGLLEKWDPDDREFHLPEKLVELVENKNYGRYANEDGELSICFIHNTDITGGNSGSPVINANGELIGCAFDGNWEAMSGDVFFEPDVQRTISVDARYILFIIDQFANAHRLMREMDIRQSNPPKRSKKLIEKRKEAEEKM